MDDAIEMGLGCLFWTFALALMALIVLGFGECYYDRQSFTAQTDCQKQRMEPKRRTWSADVVCVPINTRQDTTTVQLNQTVAK